MEKIIMMDTYEERHLGCAIEWVKEHLSAKSLQETMKFVRTLPTFETQMCALLKEIIHENGHTEFTFMNAGIPLDIIEAVSLMKRNPADTYTEFVESVATNELASRSMFYYWDYHSKNPAVVVNSYRQNYEKAIKKLDNLRMMEGKSPFGN